MGQTRLERQSYNWSRIDTKQLGCRRNGVAQSRCFGVKEGGSPCGCDVQHWMDTILWSCPPCTKIGISSKSRALLSMSYHFQRSSLVCGFLHSCTFTLAITMKYCIRITETVVPFRQRKPLIGWQDLYKEQTIPYWHLSEYLSNTQCPPGINCLYIHWKCLIEESKELTRGWRGKWSAWSANVYYWTPPEPWKHSDQYRESSKDNIEYHHLNQMNPWHSIIAGNLNNAPGSTTTSY